MRAGGLRTAEGSAPTVYRALEPAALRGGVSHGRAARVGGRPGSGETEIYTGGILSLLAQREEGRAGYGRGVAAGTYSGVLCAGGRRRRGGGEQKRICLYVLVSAALQTTGRTTAAGTAAGQRNTADAAFPDTERGGFRHQQPEFGVYLAGAGGTADADLQQFGGRVHTGLDSASSGHAHQHRPHLRLPGQTDAPAHGLL